MKAEEEIIKNLSASAYNKKGVAAPSFLARLKKKTAKKYKSRMVTHAQLLKVYHNLVKNKTIAENKNLENSLRKRAVRTLSGVAVVTVLTKPYPCPGECIFCPKEPGMPKSYLKNEPAANRAWMNKFDPYSQVAGRLKALADNGHPIDKIELIILGGTWSSYPENYQYWFVKECFRAANNPSTPLRYAQGILPEQTTKGSASKAKLHRSLKFEQRKNETAKHRIIGLTLETRPDHIDMDEIKRMRDLGCTRVELGVQSVYDDILKKSRRGHTISQTVEATKLLKDAGFKINYHMMLNLPGATPLRDRQMFKELFFNQDFQPDLLKIYPCAVLKSADLYDLWRQKKYRPYTEKQLIDLLLKIKQVIPPYVRIQRIIRDIPAGDIVAGSKTSNLRQLINNSGRAQCQCVRCRETRLPLLPKDKMKLFRQDYPASGGKEIFLSFASPDQKKLYALLRLRLPKYLFPEQAPQLRGASRGIKAAFDYATSSLRSGNNILPVLQNAALIRELHTYGQLVPLPSTSFDYAQGKSLGVKKTTSGETQHTGLGKQLMAEAERIVKNETSLKKIAVISGVGAREYYKKIGYRLKDEYMVKNI